MAAFAQFASDLDKATQFQLERGKRMVEILKQPQYQPIPVEKQIALVFAGTRGFLDKYPVEVLRRYELELYSYLDNQRSDVLQELRVGKSFEDDEKDAAGKKTGKKVLTKTGQVLVSALEDFAKQFQVKTEAAA
jgi:F-type H+-transporting ATPase subunit alpha